MVPSTDIMSVPPVIAMISNSSCQCAQTQRTFSSSPIFVFSPRFIPAWFISNAIICMQSLYFVLISSYT